MTGQVGKATTEIFARWGCRSLAAASAAEALARLAAGAFQPDVVIADYRPVPAALPGN